MNNKLFKYKVYIELKDNSHYIMEQISNLHKNNR